METEWDGTPWAGTAMTLTGPQRTQIARDRAARQSRALQTRAIDSFNSLPGLTEQLLAVQGLTSRPWRYPSIREALGVPAIFRAVALIANTTGSLAMEAYRNGVKLSNEATPKIIKRPNPLTIPRNFYRDTAYYMASCGEFWWNIAVRDPFDRSALSLVAVPPWEVKVEETKDRLRPRILWGEREMRLEDMRHGTFLPDGYRGVGPLQLCGAAASVSVESQEWAANFFTEDGGYPSLVIKKFGDLAEDPETGVLEADTLRDQWMSKPHNTPRVIDSGIESVEEFGANPQGAAMLEAREYQNGDAARMFGIPGSLLEYSRPGSSLTYQNLESEFTKFVRACLAPDYLEPIEQEMSDLLTRSTVARFNVKGFLRADIKTRAEVYEKLVPLGIMTVEEARREEGYDPGDVEFAPVPLAPPAAIPPALPVRTRTAPALVPAAEEVRCDGLRYRRGTLSPCGKLLAPDWRGKCPRCKKEYGAAA